LLQPSHKGQIGTATISGIVTDPSNAAVDSVSIVATHVATGVAYSARTNTSGFYIIPNLAVGQYQVTAEISGLKKGVRAGITLEVDDHATINFGLEVGTNTESLEVQGEAPLVDSSSATLGKVVDNAQVEELPLNGRTGLSLVELTPNTSSQASPRSDAHNPNTAAEPRALASFSALHNVGSESRPATAARSEILGMLPPTKTAPQIRPDFGGNPPREAILHIGAT
jgi:hypothetical protein